MEIEGLHGTDTKKPALKFHCSGCGVCCKRIGKGIDAAQAKRSQGKQLNVIEEALADFPHAILPDGSCSKLDVFNKCRVYDSRPGVCSVSETFKMLKANPPAGKLAILGNIDEPTYYSLNGKMCNDWQKEENMDQQYRVKEDYSNND